jgi:flagellar biosynthesis protein FliQ
VSLSETIDLVRKTLEIAFLVAAPILAVAMVVSSVISLMQVLTSMQDMTISTVPRLTAVGAFIFWLMPWMTRKLVMFTVALFGDFHRWVQ